MQKNRKYSAEWNEATVSQALHWLYHCLSFWPNVLMVKSINKHIKTALAAATQMHDRLSGVTRASPAPVYLGWSVVSQSCLNALLMRHDFKCTWRFYEKINTADFLALFLYRQNPLSSYFLVSSLWYNWINISLYKIKQAILYDEWGRGKSCLTGFFSLVFILSRQPSHIVSSFCSTPCCSFSLLFSFTLTHSHGFNHWPYPQPELPSHTAVVRFSQLIAYSSWVWKSNIVSQI